jgi:hypothetical protein
MIQIVKSLFIINVLYRTMIHNLYEIQSL